jgi:hypothetical protein
MFLLYVCVVVADKAQPFQLQSTLLLWQLIHRCWDRDIYLQPLCHRFWKLTLQLIARYSTWLEELGQEVIHAAVCHTFSYSLVKASYYLSEPHIYFIT